MKTGAALLLLCLLMALEGGNLSLRDWNKSSDEAASQAAREDHQSSLIDCVASSMAVGEEALFTVSPEPWTMAAPQMRGRRAQRGDRYQGAIVGQGPGYVTINTRCSKGRRFFTLFLIAHCVDKEQDLVTFYGSFSSTELGSKDCCNRKRFQVIQN